MAKVISVINSAYRASLEEQDDAGLWFSAAVQNAGANVDVLLTGNAVNYGLTTHAKDAVQIGGGVIPFPMDPCANIAKMRGNGSACFYVKEDAEERGLSASDLDGDIKAMSRAEVADFLENYSDIWHW